MSHDPAEHGHTPVNWTIALAIMIGSAIVCLGVLFQSWPISIVGIAVTAVGVVFAMIPGTLNKVRAREAGE